MCKRFAVAVTFVLWGAAGFAGDSFWSALISRCQPAVVRVVSYNMNGAKEYGSGFFVSSDGYIVTAAHLVSESTRVEVFISNTECLTAKIVLTHPRWNALSTPPDADIAILKVDISDAPVLTIAQRGSGIVEDEIRALGYPSPGPLGVGLVTAAGKIRGKRLTTSGTVLLQHDAPTERGYTGGPLINSEGQVIGMECYVEGLPLGVHIAIACDTILETIQAWLGIIGGEDRRGGIHGAEPEEAWTFSTTEREFIHDVTVDPAWKLVAVVIKESNPKRFYIRVFDMDTGIEIERFDNFELSEARKVKAWFLPSGDILLGAAVDSDVLLWTPGNFQEAEVFHHPYEVGELCLSPNGLYLITGAGINWGWGERYPRWLYVWDVTTGQQRYRWLLGKPSSVRLNVSSDSTLVAVFHSVVDQRQDCVTIYDLQAGKVITQFRAQFRTSRTEAQPWTVSLSPGWKYLAIGSISVPSSGRWAISTYQLVDAIVEIRSVATHELIATLQGKTSAHNLYFYSLGAFSYDNRLFAYPVSHEISVYDLTSGMEVFRLNIGGYEAGQLTFSPDGGLLVVQQIERLSRTKVQIVGVQVLNLPDGTPAFQYPLPGTRYISFSPNSDRLLLASSETIVLIRMFPITK